MYVARPWDCTSGVLEEVEASILKPSRPLVRMRVSMQRKMFADPNLGIVDKESGDMPGATQDFKPPMKNLTYMDKDKRQVLDIGL